VRPSTDPKVATLGAGTPEPPHQPDESGSPAPAREAPQKNLGDTVHDVGDTLSTTVQKTGDQLAQTVAPLGTPVSTAVQQVLNLVAGVVKDTTDGLGKLLGAHP
jgi:hypothetical protein